MAETKKVKVASQKVKHHQKLPHSGIERENLRQKGQFWTPKWVAEAMAYYVLLDKSKEMFDPAVGEGAFYKAAKQISKELGYMPTLLGREIDSEVLKEALNNGLSSEDLENVKLADFVFNPPKIPLSAIVANPPYIRHHRLTLKEKSLLKEFCKGLIGQSIDGRAGFHIYFFLRALQLLADKGRLAFIMPADTCEGVFANKLWKWIAQNFCIECVITFSPEATPFPSIDTNPIIFLIKKSPPKKKFFWVKCNESWTKDLKEFVASSFVEKLDSLEIYTRNINEGIKTGLSRSPNGEIKGIELGNFATTMRGIATGANDFFFLTNEQAESKKIPSEFLQTAIGRTRDIDSEKITPELIQNLDGKGRPTLLFSPDGRQLKDFPTAVQKYLQEGETLKLPSRSLISQRKPWYKMEKRIPPTFFFTYLGRQNIRFIKNSINALPLTGFLCVYSKSNEPNFIENLWEALNHPDTISNLQFVGKSYGNGAIKVEPRGLEKLIIPNHVIQQTKLLNPLLF